MSETKRPFSEIIMDILRDYPMVDGGEKPLLDYLDELMAVYNEMEKTFYELTEWEHTMEKQMREMKIAMKEFKEQYENK